MQYKVYFASPWFNQEQEEREVRLKFKLRKEGFEVWSPKEDCVCPPNADNEIRLKAFKSNCENIENCDIIFAVTDGKDVGTIWEAGYAAGINKSRMSKIIIIYYCETLNGNPFNLMLAQSGDIVITNFEDLTGLKEMIERGCVKSYAGKIE